MFKNCISAIKKCKNFNFNSTIHAVHTHTAGLPYNPILVHRSHITKLNIYKSYIQDLKELRVQKNTGIFSSAKKLVDFLYRGIYLAYLDRVPFFHL